MLTTALNFILNKLKLIKKSKDKNTQSMFKGMFTLAKGALLARVIGILSIPILTRIYTPEDYGVLALYISFVAVLAPVLSFRYVLALPLPKVDSIAINLFFVCLQFIFINSLVIAVIFMAFSEEILSTFDMLALNKWWVLIILGAAGTAIYELFTLWSTRKKHYKSIAKTQITQSLFGNAAKIILGLLSFKPLGLLLGQLIAQTGGVGSYLKIAWADIFKQRNKVTKERALFIIKYYKEFPIYRLPSQIMMVLSLQAPILMMAALFSKEVTGQLSLAMLALTLPANLIGTAIAKAYYAEIASLGRYNVEKIIELTVKVQKRLFSIGVPISIIGYFFFSYMFSFGFGEKWMLAGEFASLLSPFILFQFTSAPLMEVINVLGSQRSFLVLHSVRLLGLFCLYSMGKTFEMGYMEFVVYLSVYLSLFYLTASLFVFYILRIKR